MLLHAYSLYLLQITKLQAAIKYAEEDLPNAKVCSRKHHVLGLNHCFPVQTLVEQCPNDDPDTEYNMGCVLYKVTSLILPNE